MRLFNVLRNSAYSLLSFAFVGGIVFVVRKVFLLYLPIELLGVEGLFSNLVGILSLAEMGISSVISYNLYREIAAGNQKEINILLNIYRYVYASIGGLVAVVGVVLFFFLPVIVHDTSVAWEYVQLVYIIQIATVLISYFLAYKRTLLTADQKDYVSIRIDTYCSAANNVFRIIAVILFQSYVGYAVSALFFNLLANILIVRRVNRSYPYLQNISVSIKEMRERKVFKDIKNFLVHKISYIVYNSTDMIVVSSILGLRMAGLLANYVLIQTSVYSVLYKALQGIIPSIGNLIYEADKEHVLRVFRTLDMAYYLIGGYIACVYVVVLQPFVHLFFGEAFLLPMGYVVLLSINVFLGMQFENVYNFRATYGNYERDRGFMILSAITNLSCSILLSYQYGIVGIMGGTILGLLFILYGRIYIVFRFILHRPIVPYLIHHLRNGLLLVCEVTFLYWGMMLLPLEESYGKLALECILIAVAMGIMQSAIFWRSKEFQELRGYAGRVACVLRQKVRK